jgi:hypothetical protein
MERELFSTNQPKEVPALVIELRQPEKRGEEKPPSLLAVLLMALLGFFASVITDEPQKLP